jgi:hypothetical protein
MSLAELGFGPIHDSAFAAEDGPLIERFFLEHQGTRIGVHLLDVNEPLADDHIVTLANALDRNRITSPGIRALFVANTDASSDWTHRTGIGSNHEALAKSLGISLISPRDLARLLSSAVRLSWAKGVIARDLIESGPCKAQPPGSTHVGSAYKYWPALGVLGLHPEVGASITTGDVIAIELKDRYVEATVSNVQVDREGRHTLCIGTHELPRMHGERVFLLDRVQAYGPETTVPDSAEIPPGSVVAVRYGHPSRGG